MAKEVKPKLWEAIVILLLMLVIMGIGIIELHLTPVVPILMVILLLIFWGKLRGFSWDDINDSFVMGVKNGIIPLFIFLLIGSLIGVWIMAGVIPTLMVYGFHILSIRWFLPSVFLMCAFVGCFIGSAFTIISTVGIAAMGIGITMGINPAMIAGAVVSGAVFSDKMSPLSATTNLASAIAGDDLYNHIKNMMWSTVPAFVISLVLFSIIGGNHHAASLTKITSTSRVLMNNFTISIWMLIPVLLLLICAWTKIPTIPTLFINILVSIIIILVNPKHHYSFTKIADVMQNGFKINTTNPEINQILNRGGISSMMGTMTLIIIALALGGLLINLGVINVVMDRFSSHIKSTGMLVLSTVLAAIGVNIFIGEQYLSIILPGTAFKADYQKAGLAPEALGRTLEDGGAVINYLVPWGVAGVFVANTLNVPTLHYLPFVFFSLLCPVFSILSGFTGIGMKRLNQK
ncbi:Na+/H+ antiporter NhaC [Fructilactobacillus sanfranciscensis]|uniref:Na(+)/H(+) antiporter nhaC n=2 Tax=Fructilactobacillus sanfranciscensis TaxID=1625 RepID=G2KVC2_FRUST|nr:Na+/H+ antiporter NhaC [Fructilactobacillus sanfranciscensis]AEN98720.1 Na(+)/H(+) antiporter nhaC [Fructilactobacillus sanfranciscensis TMW 1.1304]KRM79115.1 Na(+) H(+) antiporter nhaC [Fructilactobacillus sanfranciscensis DSM 20451]MCG7195406.1 Na+/H+ antiporter NhaC [Fructilactobacillus sanfranciscensis]NDR75711.1 Na+/H+ antiporter NhaC [Fructilactobacillus sanfranciscensis]NDR96565.1 Na+/H+ antiporter NhaC [Fructilactobacillus sanfranciscensis]